MNWINLFVFFQEQSIMQMKIKEQMEEGELLIEK